MHIKKYDFDYSRRYFLDKTAKGIGGAGVLAPESLSFLPHPTAIAETRPRTAITLNLLMLFPPRNDPMHCLSWPALKAKIDGEQREIGICNDPLFKNLFSKQI